MSKVSNNLKGLILITLLASFQFSCSSNPTTPHPPSGKESKYQVVVYGATASGAIAAIAAAKDGLRVALVEPGGHIGGMVSGGLGATDVTNKSTIGGMSRQFFVRVGHEYGKGISWQFEPHIAEKVLRQWLEEAGVKVFLGSRLNRVQKDNLKLTAIEMENRLSFSADVFIDASYEGDLLAKDGVSYTVGREAKSTFGESLAGTQQVSPRHQFDVPVSPYDASGKLLPLVTGDSAGAAGMEDRKVQAYTYRLCMTKDKGNQVPFNKPPGYSPDHYELLRRYLMLERGSLSLDSLMDLVPIPNGKTDTNSRGPISTDLIGGSWSYPEADYAERDLIKEAHKNYIQGFLYFLANDPSVPEKLQSETKKWGLAKDEFTDNDNWPYQLYIREARRMIGSYIITQADLQTNRTKADAIGLGSYNSDSHHVQRLATPQGTTVDEGNIEVPLEPYEIPYRGIIPKANECTNLLVPVCLSASHVAYSSLRMEPQYMIMGQSAAEAAYLSIKRATPVQQVNVAELQDRLRARGQVITLRDITTASITNLLSYLKPGVILESLKAKIHGY